MKQRTNKTFIDCIADRYYQKSVESCSKPCNNQHNNQHNNPCSDPCTSYMQAQIDSANREICRLNKRDNMKQEQYNQILSELDILINNTEQTHDNCLKLSETCNKSDNKKVFITDVTKTTEIVVDQDISVVFVTMVGGGGAGGVGCVDRHRYMSGGGGGSGSCVIKKPVVVKFGDRLLIDVGRGGVATKDVKAGDTTVKVVSRCMTKETVVVFGGCNGLPDVATASSPTEQEVRLTGGSGGVSEQHCCLQGKPGNDGMVSLPSQISNEGGDGGNSVFANSGGGGSNIFSIGGESGSTSCIIGGDGRFGSGGGGSAPVLNVDTTRQVSGNGGDGFVLIEM